MTENNKQNTSKQTDQLATDTFTDDLLDLFPSLKTEQTQQDVEAMLWLARARSIPGRFDTVFSFFFNRDNQTSSQALERLKHVVTASEQLGSYDAFLTLYEHYPNKPAFFSQLPMLLDAYKTLGSLSELTALLSHDSSRQHNLSTLDVPKSVTKDKGQDRTPIGPILPPNSFDQFIVQIQPSFSLEKIKNDLSKNREHASPALEAILNDLDSLLLLAHAGTVVGSYEAVFNLFFSFPFQNKSEFVPNFTLVVDACQQLGSYQAYMDIYKSYPFPDKKAFVKNLPLITSAYEALGSYRELLDVFKRFPYKSEKELFTTLRSIVEMFPQEREPVEDVERHNPSLDALPHYRHDLLFVPKLFEVFKSFPDLQRVLLITTPNPIDLNKLRIIWQSIAADSFSDKAVALTRILE
nr:hypothetical protein [Candidatus Woesebacteria bacterium]